MTNTAKVVMVMVLGSMFCITAMSQMPKLPEITVFSPSSIKNVIDRARFQLLMLTCLAMRKDRDTTFCGRALALAKGR